MRFDNSARMQQLDVILKSNKRGDKSSKRHGKSRSDSTLSSTRSSESMARSDRSSALGRVTRNSTTASCASVKSTDSSSSSSGVSGVPHKVVLCAPPSCKDVILVEESWHALKASQTDTDRIGEAIVLRLWANGQSSRGSSSSSGMTRRERLATLAAVVGKTLEAVVSYVGPTLLEEDFSEWRHAWRAHDLDPRQVAKVLVEGLRDWAATTNDNPARTTGAILDPFEDPATAQAWEGTVVALLCQWGEHCN